MEKEAELKSRRRTNIKNIQKNTKIKDKKKLSINIKLSNKSITTLIVCALFVIIIVAINNYTSLGLVLNKNISSEEAVQIELKTSNNTIIPFGAEVLVCSKGTIICYNNHGKTIWEITLEDNIDLDISTSGAYIQATNKDKGIVYVYKNKYEKARIKVDGKIYSASINKEGTSVIEYSSNSSKTSLGVYDNSGEVKYNIKLNNKIIGKHILSDNSRYLGYIDVNADGISARTNINVIDLSNIQEGGDNAKTICSSDNSLAYDIYWDGNEIICRFQEEYIIYNMPSGKKKNIQISDAQVINISDYDQRCAYTKFDTNGNCVLVIKKMLSDKEKEIAIKETPKYLVYENGIIYVCHGKNIEVYNNFGMNIKNYDSDMIITKPVIFNNGRSLAMAISNKLVMFTI